MDNSTITEHKGSNIYPRKNQHKMYPTNARHPPASVSIQFHYFPITLVNFSMINNGYFHSQYDHLVHAFFYFQDNRIDSSTSYKHWRLIHDFMCATYHQFRYRNVVKKKIFFINIMKKGDWSLRKPGFIFWEWNFRVNWDAKINNLGGDSDHVTVQNRNTDNLLQWLRWTIQI